MSSSALQSVEERTRFVSSADSWAGEPVSFARDLLFALASVSAISGLNVPLIGVPLFTPLAMLTLLISLRGVYRSKSLKLLLVPPLLIFLMIHLGSAFRLSIGNGAIFAFQAVIVCSFVLAFVSRYSQVGMQRYLQLTGLAMSCLLVYVLGYHFAQGRYTSYKYLEDPKAIFNLLPLMLLVLRRSQARASRYLFPVVSALFIVVILLSGERKAYILLALVAPFLVNLRSPWTYVAPAILALVVVAGLSLDDSGYVARQFSTLSQFSQGNVEETASNVERSWAIHYAAELFITHPIFGVGTNAYSAMVERVMGVGIGTHNEWMRVAAENGLVGLSFYAATVLWGLLGLLRKQVGSRTRTADERAIALAMFLMFVVYLSFEALDFIVIMAFVFTPFVQYLRLDPNDVYLTARSPSFALRSAQRRNLQTGEENA